VSARTGEQPDVGPVLAALRGEHSYDRRARLGNWVAIWVFAVLGLVIGAPIDEWARSKKAIGVTPFLALSVACGLIAGGIWIETFNRTRYRVDGDRIERSAPWPRRSWTLALASIESVRHEVSHGHWILFVKVRGRRWRTKIPMTRSMRDALGLGENS
jgi:hypothetical protein